MGSYGGVSAHLLTAGLYGGTTERFLVAVAAWMTMSAVMMLPAVTPWLRMLARITRPAKGPAVGFAAGYMGVWLLFSLGAAGLQSWGSDLVAIAGRSAAFAVIAAGLYQFTPFKAACLRHCRNPLTYFLSNWRDGPRGALGMGLHHGLYCLGCCWLLMLLCLGVGMMSLAAMLGLTALICAEKILEHGELVSRAAGLGLIVWGASAFL